MVAVPGAELARDESIRPGSTTETLAGLKPSFRPDGTIAPRNNLVGDPIHRVDVRAQHRTRLGGTRTVDALIEVYNLFNRANYGTYTTQESNAQYGLPSFNNNIAFRSRSMQLGFRFAF